MVTYTYIYIYMFSSYLPIVRVCLVRQAMLSGSEMKVPNALALATGHALAAVDPAPGKRKIKGTRKTWIFVVQCQICQICQIDWCGSSLHLVPHITVISPPTHAWRFKSICTLISSPECSHNMRNVCNVCNVHVLGSWGATILTPPASKMLTSHGRREKYIDSGWLR